MPNGKKSLLGDVGATGNFLVYSLFAGLGFVVIEQWARHGLRAHSPWAALLWAFACVAVGALVGFLFGIPRTPENINQLPPPISPTSASGVTAASSDDKANATRLGASRVNTNLEQISDWLTKIIVGATLVQVQKVPEMVNRASGFIASSLGGPEEKYFAGGLLVYFIILGFLGSYLLTRIYLQPLFGRVDSGLPISEDQKEELKAARVVIGTGTGTGTVTGTGTGGVTLSESAAKAAKRLIDVPLSDLTSASDIYAWAKAQFAEGNYDQAISGFSKAINLDQNDINLRLDYAAALIRAGSPFEVVKEQVLDAYKRQTPQTNKVTKETLYRALTYTCTHLDPPEGFTSAIKYGKEYFADLSNPDDGFIRVALAAAYGQQYKWVRDRDDKSLDLATIRQNALEAARTAISINPKTKESLKRLLDPSDPLWEAKENFLEVFLNDNEFRELVGLPQK